MKKNKIDIKTEDEVIDQTFHNDTKTGDNTFDGFTDESTNHDTKENDFFRGYEDDEIKILKHNKKVINEAFDNLLDKPSHQNFEQYTNEKNVLHILREEKKQKFEKKFITFMAVFFMSTMVLMFVSSVFGIVQYFTK